MTEKIKTLLSCSLSHPPSGEPGSTSSNPDLNGNQNWKICSLAPLDITSTGKKPKMKE